MMRMLQLNHYLTQNNFDNEDLRLSQSFFSNNFADEGFAT